ncbi:hypothetical protein HG530_008778 [Fusarium avenaceum]|nr:hypothetical protein HG530_008778 [Fusarium avenaceum]
MVYFSSKLNAPVLPDFGSNSAHNCKGCATTLGRMILNLGRPCATFGFNLHLLLVPHLGCADDNDLVNMDTVHGLEPLTGLGRLGIPAFSFKRSQGVSAECELAMNVLALLVIKRVTVIHIQLALGSARLGSRDNKGIIIETHEST